VKPLKKWENILNEGVGRPFYIQKAEGFLTVKNQIKYLKNLFFDLLNDYGKVYIIVKYSEQTSVGNRGFSAEEKEKGLVLVFTRNNYRRMHWTEEGNVIVSLSFGNNKLENCFIHHDDIIALYSPDAMVKYDRWDILNMEDASKQQKGIKDISGDDLRGNKVISLEKYRNKNKT